MRPLLLSRCFLALVALIAGGAGAADRAYPTKPVRLISSYPPGGGNDTMARAIAQRLTETWASR